MPLKQKLRKEIHGAWNELFYQEENKGKDSSEAVSARAYLDGLVVAWNIMFDGEEW